MPGKVTFQVTGGPIKGKSFDFDEHDTLLFGRAEDCHARLPESDTSASRHHFLLEVSPPHARLRDLGSLNGTFVNGKKYGGRSVNETPDQAAARRLPEVDLSNGDTITVGDHVFVVRVEAPIAPTVIAPHCAECGKEVTAEIGTATPSPGYVCKACRAKAAASASPAANAGANAGADAAGALLKAILNQARPKPAPAPAPTPVAATPAPAPSGPRFGEYTVIRELGRGAMGVVYLGQRPSDGARVAIKLMLAQVAVSEHARKLFHREIETTKALTHPNIVRLLDHGSAGKDFYCVLEFCDGGSLDGLMKRRGGRIPVREAVTLTMQALDGLHYAHQLGYVHRDLKPENILLTAPDGGVARVSDFGLAKNFQKAGLSDFTRTGAVGGTLAFMPREQITNYKYVKPTADVFSMGATLYTMLTGQLVRDFPERTDPIAVILSQPTVPIRRRDASIPARLAEAIERAIAPKPDERWASAADFRRALEQAL